MKHKRPLQILTIFLSNLQKVQRRMAQSLIQF